MIENLRVGKTANFHNLKRSLSNAAIDDLFRQVRAAQPSASQNLFHHRRVQAGDAVWSAISFLYDRSPSFMLDEAAIHERVCGFLLLIEHRNHVAIFKSKLDLPAGFVTRYLGRVPAERIDIAIARHDAVFQKIRLRNMSVSKHAMRNKTFEADDLRDVVGPAGANRYVPQAYAVRSGTEHYSTTPSTGRIAQRSDRVDHLTLVDYAKAVIDELVTGRRQPAAFIRTFARAIDLASISGLARPTTFAVNVPGLAEALHETREIRIVRPKGDRFITLSKDQSDMVLAELDTVLAITGDGPVMELRSGTEEVRVGAIAINKSRVALRDLQLPHSAQHWLFPGPDATRPLTTRSVQRACRRAADAAGLDKNVTVHTLRHSFATHLLEQGVDIRIIQDLLGHRHINSTTRYARAPLNTIRQIESPLDTLKIELRTSA